MMASAPLAAGLSCGCRAAVSPPRSGARSKLSDREVSRAQAGGHLPHSTHPAGLGSSVSQPQPLIQTSRSAGNARPWGSVLGSGVPWGLLLPKHPHRLQTAVPC